MDVTGRSEVHRANKARSTGQLRDEAIAAGYALRIEERSSMWALWATCLRMDGIGRRTKAETMEELDMIVETLDGLEEFRQPVRRPPLLNSLWSHPVRRYAFEDERAGRRMFQSVYHNKQYLLKSNCKYTEVARQQPRQQVGHERRQQQHCYGGGNAWDRRLWRWSCGRIEYIRHGIVAAGLSCVD